MVLYVDTAFAVNALADGLALYAAAALSGIRLSWRRLLAVAAVGGVYGVGCLLPGLEWIGGFFPQMAAGAALVRLAFGGRGPLPRLFVMFFLLSCTLAGALVSLPGLWERQGAWLVFFSAAGGAYAALGWLFRGSQHHRTAGELLKGSVCANGRRAVFTALRDTGHTLRDTASGRPVLTVRAEALSELWRGETAQVLDRLGQMGPVWCLQRLDRIQPGAFRLLPYRAVGVEHGLLLCFCAEEVAIEGRALGPVTVAIWPGELGCGEGFNALWRGESDGRKEREYAA